LPAIMVGHLPVPALDPTPGVPSTFSPPTVAGRLRRGLGFADGLVFTDALDMGAVAARTGGPETEPAVRALLAGVDVPLLPDDPHRAARAIRDSVTSGRLPRSRLEEAVRRIESRVAGPSIRAPIARTSRAETAALALEIARRAVVRNAAAPPPALAGEKVALTLLDDSADGEAAAGLRARLEHAGIAFADGDEEAVPLVVVLADIRDHKGRVGLPDEARSRLERVVARRREAELLVVGPPGAVPAAARPLRTTHVFGTDRASLDAAAEVLTGRLAASGHADWSR
ncbi:MAG: glycoside hydrolase family 3 N-terminal domain-containing protein, partial [Planctomycetota bacterium JB042]